MDVRDRNSTQVYQKASVMERETLIAKYGEPSVESLTNGLVLQLYHDSNKIPTTMANWLVSWIGDPIMSISAVRAKMLRSVKKASTLRGESLSHYRNEVFALPLGQRAFPSTSEAPIAESENEANLDRTASPLIVSRRPISPLRGSQARTTPKKKCNLMKHIINQKERKVRALERRLEELKAKIDNQVKKNAHYDINSVKKRDLRNMNMKSKLRTERNLQKRMRSKMEAENLTLVTKLDEAKEMNSKQKSKIARLAKEVDKLRNSKGRKKTGKKASQIVYDQVVNFDGGKKEEGVCVIETKQKGEYSEAVRICVMELAGLEVATGKMALVMKTVGDLCGVTFERLPSRAACQRIVDEGHVLAKSYLTDEVLKNCKTFGIHKDGTQRKKVKILDTSIRTDSGESYCLGWSSVASETGEAISMEAREKLHELGETTQAGNKEECMKQMLEKLSYLMNDRAANEKKSSRLIEEWRESCLKDFGVRDKRQVHHLFCSAHVLLGFHTYVMKEINLLEQFKSSAYKHPVTTLLNDASTIFGPVGDHRGVRMQWEAYCKENEIKSFIKAYKDNRFNGLFEVSAQVHHHREDFSQILASIKSKNAKQTRLFNALEDSNLKLLIECLGVFFHKVTGPFWLMVTGSGSSFQRFGPTLKFLKESLGKCIEDPSSLFQANSFYFLPAYTTSSCTKPDMSPQLSPLQKEIIIAIAKGLQTALQVQLGDFLDGGSYSTPDSLQELPRMPLTNLLCERNFGHLDASQKRRPHSSLHHHSSVMLLKQTREKMSQWIQNKPEQEKAELLKMSRTNASLLRTKHRQQDRNAIMDCLPTLKVCNPLQHLGILVKGLLVAVACEDAWYLAVVEEESTGEMDVVVKFGQLGKELGVFRWPAGKTHVVSRHSILQKDLDVEFLAYCADSLDQDGPKVMKILESKYKSCSIERRSSHEMIDLLKETMKNMKKEPNRAFVHLKNLVGKLKIWSRAKEVKKITTSTTSETNTHTKEQGESDVRSESEIRTDQDCMISEKERESDSPTSDGERLKACSQNARSPIKADCKAVLIKSEITENLVETVTSQPPPSSSKSYNVSIVDGNFSEASLITKAIGLKTVVYDEHEIPVPGPSKSIEEWPQEKTLIPKSSSESISTKAQSSSIPGTTLYSPRKSSTNYTPDNEPPLKSTIILEVGSNSPKVQHIQSISHSMQNTPKPSHCQALQFKTHSLLATPNVPHEAGVSDYKDRIPGKEQSCVSKNDSITTQKPISFKGRISGKDQYGVSKNNSIVSSKPIFPVTTRDGNDSDTSGENETTNANDFTSTQQWSEARSSCEKERPIVSSHLESTTAFTYIEGRRSSGESQASTIEPSDEQPPGESLVWKEVVDFGPISHKSAKECYERNKPDSQDVLEDSSSTLDPGCSELPENDFSEPESDLMEQVAPLPDSDPEKTAQHLPLSDNMKPDSDAASVGRSPVSSTSTIVNKEAEPQSEEDPLTIEISKFEAAQKENKNEVVVTVNSNTSSSDEDKTCSSSSPSESAKSSVVAQNQSSPQNILSENKNKHETSNAPELDLNKKDDMNDEKKSSSIKGYAEDVENPTFPGSKENVCKDNKDFLSTADTSVKDSESAKTLIQNKPDKSKALSKEDQVDRNKEERIRPFKVADVDLIQKTADNPIAEGKRTVKKQPRRALLVPYVARADESVIARKLRQENKSKDKDSSSSGDEFVSESNVTKVNKIPQQNLSAEEEKRQRHITKLEKLLESLRDEIEKCQTREMSIEDLDEVDSSYIYEDKLKNKFVKVWEKLCEVTKRTKETGRPTERSIKFSSTRYKEINRRLERFLNKTKCFPDIHDVKCIIKMTNTKYKLGLTSSAMQNIAREAFVDIGEMLQSRRHEDFIASFGTRQTDMMRMGSGGMDPYWTDPLLRKKLDSNRVTAKSNLEKVIAKYSHLQESKGKEESDDEDEEEEEDRGSKAHAKTSMHRKKGGKMSSSGHREDSSRINDTSESEKDDLDDDKVDEETRDSLLPRGSKHVPEPCKELKKSTTAPKVSTLAGAVLGPSPYLSSSRQPDVSASPSFYTYHDTDNLDLSKASVPIDVDHKSNYLESVGLLSLSVNPFLHKEQESPKQSPLASKFRKRASLSLPSSPSSFIEIEDSPAKASNSKLSVISVDTETEEKTDSDLTIIPELRGDRGHSSPSKQGSEFAPDLKPPKFFNPSFEAVEDLEDQTSDSDSNEDGDEDIDDDIVTILSSPCSRRESESEISREPSPISVTSLDSTDEVPNTAADEPEHDASETVKKNGDDSFDDTSSSEKMRMMTALNLMRVPGRESMKAESVKTTASVLTIKALKNSSKRTTDRLSDSMKQSHRENDSSLVKTSYISSKILEGKSPLLSNQNIKISCNKSNVEGSENFEMRSTEEDQESQGVAKVSSRVDKDQKENISSQLIAEPSSDSHQTSSVKKIPEADLPELRGTEVALEEEEMDLDLPECYIDVVDEEMEEDFVDLFVNGKYCKSPRISKESNHASLIHNDCMADSDKTEMYVIGSEDAEADFSDDDKDQNTVSDDFNQNIEGNQKVTANADAAKGHGVEPSESLKERKSTMDSAESSIASEKVDVKAQNEKLHLVKEATSKETAKQALIVKDSKCSSENLKTERTVNASATESSSSNSARQDSLVREQIDVGSRDSTCAASMESDMTKHGTKINSHTATEVNAGDSNPRSGSPDVGNGLQPESNSEQSETVSPTLPWVSSPISSSKIATVQASQVGDEQSISLEIGRIQSGEKDSIMSSSGSVYSNVKQTIEDHQRLESDTDSHTNVPSPHHIALPSSGKSANPMEADSDVDATNETSGKIKNSDGRSTNVANTEAGEKSNANSTTTTITSLFIENKVAEESIELSGENNCLSHKETSADEHNDTTSDLAPPAQDNPKPAMKNVETDEVTSFIAGLVDELVHNSSCGDHEKRSLLNETGNPSGTLWPCSEDDQISESENPPLYSCLSNNDSVFSKSEFSDTPTEGNISRVLVSAAKGTGILHQTTSINNESKNSEEAGGGQVNIPLTNIDLSIATLGNKRDAYSDFENATEPEIDEQVMSDFDLSQESKLLTAEDRSFPIGAGAEKAVEHPSPTSRDAEKEEDRNSEEDMVNYGEKLSNSVAVTDDLAKISPDKDIGVGDKIRPGLSSSVIGNEKINTNSLDEEGSTVEKEVSDSDELAIQPEKVESEKKSSQCKSDEGGVEIDDASKLVEDKGNNPNENCTDEIEEKFKDDLFQFISEICNGLVDNATPDKDQIEGSEKSNDVPTPSSTKEDRQGRSTEDTSPLETCTDKNAASANETNESTNSELKNSTTKTNLEDGGKIEASTKDGLNRSQVSSLESLDSKDIEIIEELSDPKGIRVSSRSKEEDRQMVDALLTAMAPAKKDGKATSNSQSKEQSVSHSTDSDSERGDGKMTETDSNQEKTAIHSDPHTFEKGTDPSKTNDKQQEPCSSNESKESNMINASGDKLNQTSSETAPKELESGELTVKAAVGKDSETLKRKFDDKGGETNDKTDKENEVDDDDDITITSVEMAGPPAKKIKTLPGDITDIISAVYHNHPPRKTAPSSTQGTSKPNGCSKNNTDVTFIQGSVQKPTSVLPVSVYRNQAFFGQHSRYSGKQVVDTSSSAVDTSSSASSLRPGWRGQNKTLPAINNSRNPRVGDATSNKPYTLTGRSPRQEQQAPKIITARPYIPASQMPLQQTSRHQTHHSPRTRQDPYPSASRTRQDPYPSAASMIASTRNMHGSILSSSTSFSSRMPMYAKASKTPPSSHTYKPLVSPYKLQGVSSRAMEQIRMQNPLTPAPRRTTYQRPFNKGVGYPEKCFRASSSNPIKPVSASPNNKYSFPSPRKTQKNLDGLKIVLDDNSDEEEVSPSRQPSGSGKRKVVHSVTPKIVSVCSLNKPSDSNVPNRMPLGSSKHRVSLPASKSSESEQIVLSDSD